jgi:hypothetical protein
MATGGKGVEGEPTNEISIPSQSHAYGRQIPTDVQVDAHTLRKTWGYQQRVTHGVGFEIICKRYSHSRPAITMRYLGIEDREVHDVLMNEIG